VTEDSVADTKKLRAALVQLRATRSVVANVDQAAKLIREAKAAGAEYVQTPEQTSLMELDRKSLFANIVEENHDPALAAFQELARELMIHLHIGSLSVKVSPDKAANRAFLIGTDGEIMARYDKIHLFDVDLPGKESYRESNTFRPGETAIVVGMPWGGLGLSICYDVRFPQLYRALAEAGADFLTVPAAFTKQTGEAHWHVLLRARAVENGAFVLAAAQGGTHENGRETYGHSLIIDPWGKVIAEGGIEPSVIMAELDPALVTQARSRIPSLDHGRRFEVISPASEVARLHVVGRGT
jgi:predicted amidohydrolase